MRFLKLPLAFLLNHQVHIVTEMHSVVAAIVMVWAEIYDKILTIRDSPISPTTIDMMQMQSYIVASVKVFPAEVAFFIVLEY